MNKPRMISATLAAGGLLMASNALAKECVNETIDYDVEYVFVPEGASCWVVGATVTNGNVQADKAKRLIVRDSLIRNGDIQATEVSHGVRVLGNMLPNGNVQVEKSYDVRAVANMVRNGDVQVSENSGIKEFTTRVNNNVVWNGNIQVVKNEKAGVFRNTASGDIQCYDNALLAQGGNTAGGDLECID